MAAQDSFAVGEAPWEKSGSSAESFPVGQAPWETAKPAQSSTAQTALEHFGKGASLGYLAQLQAMAEPVTDRIGNLVTGAKVDEAPLKQMVAMGDGYVKSRDANIKRIEKEASDHPAVATSANVAGGLVSGIAASPILPGMGSAATTGGKIAAAALHGAKTGALYGLVSNPGDVEGQVDPIQGIERLKAMKSGAETGLLTGGAVAAVPALATAAGNKLNSMAEKFAVNATGATGKQASEFADGAGRELLDRGIVRFGDNQAKISSRATQALNEANAQIDGSLRKLQDAGVKVDANKIYQTVRETINDMKGDPAKADVVKILEGHLDNLVQATDARGTTELPIKEAEDIKRSYNRLAGNWADPEKSMAGKTMYQATRKGVEDAAQAADPETARLFEEGKKTYGLLAPIQEAAERRASVTQQHAPGGFLDLAAGVAGEHALGPLGMIGVPVARRVIAPRAAASMAVAADKLGDALKAIPHLSDLAQKNPNAFQSIVSQLSNPASFEEAPIKAAEEKVPTKGPEKWANDGVQKLIDHTNDQSVKDALTKNKGAMLADPKLKALLISASDLKPGTKAMDGILQKIKDAGAKE